MTKLERLKKIGDHLEGRLYIGSDFMSDNDYPKITYDASDNISDDIPEAVQQSLIIQQIADDIQVLRNAVIPHLVRHVKGKQQESTILILI